MRHHTQTNTLILATLTFSALANQEKTTQITNSVVGHYFLLPLWKFSCFSIENHNFIYSFVLQSKSLWYIIRDQSYTALVALYGNIFGLVDCDVSWIFLLLATANEFLYKPVWHRGSAFHCPCKSIHISSCHISHYLNVSRGKGPLKNSSDVINAAKKIAEAGSRMDKLARAVADQVALQLCLSPWYYLLLVFLSVWDNFWLDHCNWRQTTFWFRVSGHGHWKPITWAVLLHWLFLSVGPTLRELDSQTKLCLSNIISSQSRCCIHYEMSTLLKHADRPFSISNQSVLCLGKGEWRERGVFI